MRQKARREEQERENTAKEEAAMEQAARKDAELGTTAVEVSGGSSQFFCGYANGSIS